MENLNQQETTTTIDLQAIKRRHKWHLFWAVLIGIFIGTLLTQDWAEAKKDFMKGYNSARR